MHLKALRTRLGITQQALAEKLSTSQQTVARWESGSSQIPTKYLKDMAVLLGCSIPSLLGVDAKGKFKDEKKAKKVKYGSDLLYGTVTVSFGSDEGNVRDWPISEGNQTWVLAQMERRSGFGGEYGAPGWLSFETLDDRIVFVNSSALEAITLVCDDIQAAPDYEHREVYQLARELLYSESPTQEELDRDDSPYSQQLLDKCQALIAGWGGHDAAHARMKLLKVERLDGSQEYLRVEEEGVTDLAICLTDSAEGDLSHSFANLESDGDGKASFYRYGALRLIEMSLIEWNEVLGQSEGQDEA